MPLAEALKRRILAKLRRNHTFDRDKEIAAYRDVEL